MKKQLMCLTGVLISMIISTTAWADVLDPLDNSSAPVGTKVLVSYFGYQHLPEYENENGTTVDIGTDVAYAAFRPVYFAGKVFGKTWGFNAVVPFQRTFLTGFNNFSSIFTKTNCRNYGSLKHF